ncbi:LysE family translocator [Trebonia kvetii]|uniref:LysE family translocator n=1 Tax=Trebonia kvetii TaxID=2480626 RepID=UPI001C9E663C|nr:LysE family transporter [Trebonia kvetii]
MGHILSVLPAFLLACVAVAALPGPSTALFLHRTVRDGRKAGLAAVAGNEIGVFCWALAAGAGLTALLRANAILFTGMHLVGAAVLVYLGVSAWRSARRADGEFGEALQLHLPTGGRRRPRFAPRS